MPRFMAIDPPDDDKAYPALVVQRNDKASPPLSLYGGTCSKADPEPKMPAIRYAADVSTAKWFATADRRVNLARGQLVQWVERERSFSLDYAIVEVDGRTVRVPMSMVKET